MYRNLQGLLPRTLRKDEPILSFFVLCLYCKTWIVLQETMWHFLHESGMTADDVISTLIPLLVMTITLFVTNKGTEKQLRESEAHHHEEMQAMENMSRISYLPYLMLGSHGGSFDPYRGLLLHFRIRNVGNGPALECRAMPEHVLHDFAPTMQITGLVLAHKQFLGTTYDYKPSGFLTNNALAVGDEADFSIYLEVDGRAAYPNVALESSFKLRFVDAHMNLYEQRFSFQHRGEQIGRTNTDSPVLMRPYGPWNITENPAQNDA